MEPHKLLDGIEAYRPSISAGPRDYFTKAHEFAKRFYSDEMLQIASVKFEEVTVDYFFREYIWVVHATGFSAKAVGKFMPRLVAAYGIYDDLAEQEFESAFVKIQKVCNNPQKARAIWKTARFLADKHKTMAWEKIREDYLSSPEKLVEFPYIGKVTCFHLARNIGLLECVKPDLHLIRMAEHWKFKNCVEMCEYVRPDKMPLGIVDLILWYAASTFGTIDIRQEGQR